jgi:antirestriction protein ArdC
MATKNTPRKSNPEDRAAKVQAAKDSLAEGLRALVTGSDWQGVLDAMAKRSKLSPARFSFNNQILVAMQRENARFVATFEAWKRQGRFVQKGEKGIAILQPCPWKRTEKNAKGEEVEVGGVFFKILYVFALEQTEGKPFDTGEDVCQDVTGKAPVADLTAFARRLDAVGSVELRSRKAFDPDKAFGWYNRTTKGIVVVTGEDRSEASLFATMVHEVAHAILHGNDEHHDRAEKEIEAESVAYVVCKALGLDTAGFSFPYVATWAGRSKDALKEIEKSGARIAKAADQILSAIEPTASEEAEAA